MPIEQTLLRAKALKFKKPLFESLEKQAELKKVKTAFLCHSHVDKDLTEGLLVFFQEQEIDLFIDWMDSTMPKKPNEETANKIKQKITDSDYFFFLATESSCSSRWCPWEIGFADSSIKPIYIIPTSYNIYNYGSEYLKLYSKIDIGISKYYGNKALVSFSPYASEGKFITKSFFNK